MPSTDHPELVRTKAAPGELEHLRQFVNTLDVETGEDELATADALRDWLATRGMLDGTEPLTDADLERAHAVREALRRLLRANNGDAVDREAIDLLNGAAKSAELLMHFDANGGGALIPGRAGFDGALARLLAIAARAMAEGTWTRLKACAEESCEWAFYDWSKNRSGTWCKMQVCGNRAKARTYRERRASAS